MKSILLLFVLPSLLGALWAQPEQTVSVSFTVASWGKPIEGLGYRQNGTLRKLVADEFDRSQAYVYTGPPKMDIYRLPPPAAPGSAVPARSVAPPVVGTAIFEPSVKRATLVLLPLGGKFEAIVIPEDSDKFPPGHALLINGTRTRLGILCNQKDTVVLAPRERRLVPRNSRGELDALVAREHDGVWQSLNRSYVPVLPDQQTIIAFVKDPNEKDAVEFVVFRQKAPDPDAEKAKQP